jgi:AcrR family transcriptional regulator
MERRASMTALTRARILSAAGEWIVRNRSSDLQVTDVAALADVAPRTVYNHFPTVDDLLSETMEQVTSEFLTIRLQDPLPSESAAEAMDRVVREWYANLSANSELLRALLQIHGSPAFDAALDHARTVRRTTMTAVLRRAEAEGSLAQPFADALSLGYALTGFAAWAAFVDEQGMTGEAAGELVARTMTAVVSGATASAS